MNDNTHKIGLWGEDVAAGYLEKKGYTILDRNFHTPVGEIDIVAACQDVDSSCLVFVEVKTRTRDDLGYPEESINRKKWNHLQAAIQVYLTSHLDIKVDWRVDVISIVGQPSQDHPQITHFENVLMFDEREI